MLDLKKLEESLNEALSKETKESLDEWIESIREREEKNKNKI